MSKGYIKVNVLMVLTGVLVLCLGAFIALNTQEGKVPEKVQEAQAVTSADTVDLVTSEAIKQQVNQFRVQNGVGELASNSLLDTSAQTRADYLCENNVWSHEGWQRTVATYLSRGGSAGENLEYGPIEQTAQFVVTSWDKSPSHRENMVRGSFFEQGVGIRYCLTYQGRTSVIVVNHFGGR